MRREDPNREYLLIVADAVVEATTLSQYHQAEKKFTVSGFKRDIGSEVICRWRHAGTGVLFDLMPTDPAILGFLVVVLERVAVRQTRALGSRDFSGTILGEISAQPFAVMPVPVSLVPVSSDDTIRITACRSEVRTCAPRSITAMLTARQQAARESMKGIGQLLHSFDV